MTSPDLDQRVNQSMQGPEQTRPTRNIIFIGETGSGKSSVINLIADQDRAVTSSEASPCTAGFDFYDVRLGGRTYRLWDTPGLNEPSRGLNLFKRPHLERERSLKTFLRERWKAKELDLLVVCVRGSRAREAVSRVYKAFCHPTRQVAIPVVVAITHLERAQPVMDAWWQENERAFGNLGLIFDGHACITCLASHHRRWGAQQDIHDLITRNYQRLPAESVDYLNKPNPGCVIS